MTPSVKLCDKIKVKRLELGISQAGLAKKSGLTQATISRLESGEVTQLKSEKLVGLARALRVTVDFLVGDTERMQFGETLKADDRARVIFRGYENLSEERRQQLQDFVNYLVGEQRKKKRGD